MGPYSQVPLAKGCEACHPQHAVGGQVVQLDAVLKGFVYVDQKNYLTRSPKIYLCSNINREMDHRILTKRIAEDSVMNLVKN